MKFLINLETQRSSDPSKLGHHYQCKKRGKHKGFPKRTDFHVGKVTVHVKRGGKEMYAYRGIWNDNDNRTGREDASG